MISSCSEERISGGLSPVVGVVFAVPHEEQATSSPTKLVRGSPQVVQKDLMVTVFWEFASLGWGVGFSNRLRG
jgi:hypothetical protein